MLDPFYRCASTLEAIHELGRRWIDIDIAIQAVNGSRMSGWWPSSRLTGS